MVLHRDRGHAAEGSEYNHLPPVRRVDHSTMLSRRAPRLGYATHDDLDSLGRPYHVNYALRQV